MSRTNLLINLCVRGLNANEARMGWDAGMLLSGAGQWSSGRVSVWAWLGAAAMTNKQDFTISSGTKSVFEFRVK